MDSLKLYYVTSELTPFSETYSLSDFSRRFCSILHQKEGVDIRLAKPKFGFISERKYILREVIRLKEMPINFNGIEKLVNMKSAFIPETRVQVYFIEDENYFKTLPELLYKARNGRIFKDNDERYAFFSRVALDTLKNLFWAPDVILCNDWQMSFIPQLLRDQYQENDFYKNIKTAFVIHSLDDFRFFTKESYEMLGLKNPENTKIIDNVKTAIKYSDYTFLINDSENKLLKEVNNDSALKKVFDNSNHLVVENKNGKNWLEIASQIEDALRSC